ncbi:hypothetical protein [Kitasatospora cheerisanensis]|uniref:Uncharacterized protein n=1 Tax=Kitasatospora cheerisanensis KCTC 2395 TaxID=1348663 RepID=A0A066YQX6_9ACTN|nr:hypothetical protein [Kitasatospora cheerisanensis]KDN80491.1 hypothetical protein KCH_77250 [Kitasatospora cheerisanensis KCTC 2395]
MDLDHLYRIPVAALLGAGFDALPLLVPRPSWEAIRPRHYLGGAVLGAAVGTAACTPALRHAARIALTGHPGWIDIVCWAVLATAIAMIVAADRWIRAHDDGDAEQTRQS